METARVHPETLTGDPFAAQDHSHACLNGYVYLGHTYVSEETGEEVEAHESAASTRRSWSVRARRT